MKKAIRKIWSIGLIVLVLSSLLVMAIPAAADDNKWQAEKTPTVLDYLLYSDNSSNVADLAVYGSGSIVWAVTGTDNYSYMTTNGGLTWTRGNATAFTFQPNLIAIAPDNSAVIAVVDTVSLACAITRNSGTKWDTLPAIADMTTLVPATAITGLDVSATASSVNYVAVSGIGGGVGNVWYFDEGTAAPNWHGTNTLAGFAAAGSSTNTTSTVAAIAFSPNFASDLTMAAVTANYTTPEIDLNLMSYSGAVTARKWNQAAGFPTQYPATFGTVTGLSSITKAYLALDPEYLGSDDALRNSFAAFTFNVSGNAGGIYRMEDYTATGIKTNVAFYSVAYDGTNLAAGVNGSTTVWRSDDAMATTPTFYASSSLKNPGGTGSTVVAFAGSNVFAGTSGANSAFAASSDYGKSFNDLSLIDTTITNSRDIAAATDGSKAYWVSDNGAYTSVWRYDSTGYQRVLSMNDAGPFIVRIAPADPTAVYVAKKAAATIYFTKDSGQTKWYTRTCGITNIQDLAVETVDISYALGATGTVAKSTNQGFTWGSGVQTRLATPFSLTLAKAGTLLVGSTDGKVSYSTDSNTTWTAITKSVEASTGNVTLAADTKFDTNNTFYAIRAVASSNVMSWVLGVSTDWTDIISTTIGSKEYPEGIGTVNGALYVLTYSTTDNQSRLYQALSPLTATSSSPSWSNVATTTTSDADDAQLQLGYYSVSPNALKLSATSTMNKAWAVKTNATNKLYSYNDVLAVSTPSLISPPTNFSDMVNIVTGKANEIAFYWNRLSNATAYKLYIAYDSGFKQVVTSIDVADDKSTVSKPVGPDRTDTSLVNFMPGTTYYWRLKATTPLYSPYSEARTFTVQPGAAMVPQIGAPTNGFTGASTTPAFSWTPVSGTTMYQFQLSANTTFDVPLADSQTANTGIQPSGKLTAGSTYFWRVRALTPVQGDWSTIANFTVALPPTTAAPPVVVTQVPAPVITMPAAPPATTITIPPAPTAQQIVPGFIWAIVIIGAVLVIAVIILIVRTRRTV